MADWGVAVGRLRNTELIDVDEVEWIG